VADNTFATPFMQRPLSFGADIVVHSTTKFLNGHGTGIAGAIVCRDAQLMAEKLIPVYRLYGGSGNPWDAWLVLNGLKTLPLRMERHSHNAQVVAEWLVNHPEVAQVNYPGLPGHPDEATIKAQMAQNGGILSFELAGGTEAGTSFMNRIKFCTLTPTLGDVDTLVLHPATMSHRGVDPAVRAAHGISDGLVRLSVGVEAVEDIIADLAQAIG
jgi:methionine-gamma-lyase